MIQPGPERAEQLTVLGQLLTSKNVLLQRFRDARAIDDLKPLLELEDNYVAAYTSEQHVWIVNSLYSLNSYFYSFAGGVFLHGDTVAAVASKGPVDLTWNHEAIADLMALGHLVGDDTLVRGVHPVPQGAVLHWDGSRLTVRRFHRRDLAQSVGEGDVASNLVDLFLRGLEAGAGSRPIATSSSGLDSRVILAGLLHLGMRPELLVMGDPESKDVRVVKQMATAFGLRVNHISLDAREYADHATEICRLTDGMKSVDHWHSYFLGRKSGYSRDDHVMTGNNGEHVRAAGFDYGVLAVGLDHLSQYDGHVVSDALLAKYWKMKTHLLLSPDELRQCAPAFLAYYGSRRQTQKFMAVMPPDESFVWQNDAFVLEQRRRTFQACGLRLMSTGYFPYSPYMRKAWIDSAWRLGLSWRLGSRWHRYAVERLYPALLEFPEEKEARHMLRRFFTGPPFAGALLLPPALAARLDAPGTLPRGLAQYCCRFDWPDTASVARGLTRRANVGLILRWEAALAELRAFLGVDLLEVKNTLGLFAHRIQSAIRENPDLRLHEVPPLPRSERSHDWDALPTVFTFSILSSAGQGSPRRPLTPDEARQIYLWLNSDLSHCLPPGAPARDRALAARLFHIGQPVAISTESGKRAGALRISAGARLVSGEPSLLTAFAHLPPIARVEREISDALACLDKVSLMLMYFDAIHAHNPRPRYETN